MGNDKRWIKTIIENSQVTIRFSNTKTILDNWENL